MTIFVTLFYVTTQKCSFIYDLPPLINYPSFNYLMVNNLGEDELALMTNPSYIAILKILFIFNRFQNIYGH